MDNDDIAHPQRLERQVEFLEANPEYALVGSQIGIVDEEGRRIGRRKFPLSHEDIMRAITKETPVAHSSTMIRTQVMKTSGGYSERYPGCGDYELWLRLSEHYGLANLPDTLVKYRKRKGQLTDIRLKENIRNTLAIQRQWITKPGYFKFGNLVRHLLKYSLLVLPPAVINPLFNRVLFNNS